MSQLVAKKLGEVCTLQRGFDLPTRDRIAGAFPLVSSSGIIDTHHEGPVKAPGVVTGRSGSIGNLFFVEDDFWPLNTTLYVRDFHGNDPRFVFHLLYQFDLKRFAGGTGVPTLNRNDVHDVIVHVPDSVGEQHRIVAILDDAFDGIASAKANAEKNLQNARALFESELYFLFKTGGEGWIEKTLGEACVLRSGTTLPKELEKESGELPYLKVADMNLAGNLNGVTVSSRYIDAHDVNSSNILPTGTTIFPKRGGSILTNKKRLTTLPICADLNIMGVMPKAGLLPEFLFGYFLGLDLRTINNGSSIPQINNYSIAPLLISFPRSLAEQQLIVEKIGAVSDEVQRLESLYQQKLTALAGLKKSLLHEAFSGRL